MNLAKLFEMQKALDERIVREKGLEGQDLLPNKILSLQVELGELANEWRGFKHWSSNREMRRDKALEEYVDCLHFILSIGLELGVDINREFSPWWKFTDTTKMFLQLFWWFETLERDELLWDFPSFVELFLALGDLLGFTWEEVEQAYLAKNAVNHERQANGY